LKDDRAIQRGRLRRTWKENVDKDVTDVHMKPSDAMDHSKWRVMIRWYWSGSNNDSDTKS